MSYPLHARVTVKRGRNKGMNGTVVHIGNGWYIGRTYTVQFDNQQVKVVSKKKLDFMKWGINTEYQD